ncbi:MAG: class I SAM-dependent methyltransferase [Candidatus Kerfeldbacteria bacterium]
MDYTDHVRSTYDAIAEDYANNHPNDTWDDDYIELFSLLLPTGANILELGCGPGVEVKKLRNRGYNVHGLDISERILSVARRLNPDSPFTRGDMRKLSFEDASFDGVFAKASLLHIEKGDAPKVLSEAERILVPKGLFHVAVKKKTPRQQDGFITENDYGYPYSRYFSFWTSPQLRKVLEKAGFDIVHATETKTQDKQTTWIKMIARCRT